MKKVVGAVVLILLASGTALFWSTYTKSHTQYSRMWMEYAMNIVKDKKPSPPASARLYAYVGTVYYEVLEKTKNQDQANLATAHILNVLYPDLASDTDQFRGELTDATVLSPDSYNIVQVYTERVSSDQRTAAMVDRPSGEEYWAGENPLEPLAGNWKRWIVEGHFEVPPPLLYGSTEYAEAVRNVKDSMDLTHEQAKAIKFWGGGPGTEAPAGIWQNRLYTMTQDTALTDTAYAYMQMVLAQSLADAFIECWKIKYTYWTKRPSMSDQSIDLIWMANPNFPSYVSGHAVVSFTAATVLSALMPEYTEVWNRDAEEAKNSRVWAGIHFVHDIEEGKMLGTSIGNAIIQRLGLRKYSS